jgi:hypothetical protein
MPFCSGASASYTDTELNAMYIPQSGGNPSIIATVEGNLRTRNEDGRLSSNSIAELVSRMISLNFIPVPPTSTRLGRAVTDAERTTFTSSDNTFKTNVRNEFCYYSQRYDYARNKMIQILSSSTPQTAEFGRYQSIAQMLNRRLYDIANIVESIKTRRDDSSDTINTLFTDMTNYLSTYRSSSNVNTDTNTAGSSTSGSTGTTTTGSTGTALPPSDVSMDVENTRRQMMAYTKEKVRATENLLSLYSFMNIFAIGMLVYVYRSMEE